MQPGRDFRKDVYHSSEYKLAAPCRNPRQMSTTFSFSTSGLLSTERLRHITAPAYLSTSDIQMLPQSSPLAPPIPAPPQPFIPTAPVSTVSFKLIRLQYPVRLAFSMTMNKSQGQSLKYSPLPTVLKVRQKNHACFNSLPATDQLLLETERFDQYYDSSARCRLRAMQQTPEQPTTEALLWPDTLD
jgi:hypothetical protein